MKTMLKGLTMSIIAILFAISAQATHIIVAVNTNYMVGTSSPYNILIGGDTLFLTGGTWGYIYLKNFTGSPSAPIVVINKGGVVSCGRKYTYGIKIGGCRYIKYTGTGTSDKYGFHVTAPSGDGVSIGDLSSDIELCNVRMDTCLLRGIVAKTDAQCGGYAYRKNFTQYNTLIHDCYINNTVNEGMYVGSSFYTGETFTCSGVDSTIYPSVLNNCQVYNNIVLYAGFDGIQVASVPVGCSIHDNLIMYNSTSGTFNQRSGIMFGGGDVGNCYNNYIYMGKGDGIEDLGLGGSKFYNNVIVGAGTGYYPGNQSYPVHGIYSNDNANPIVGSEDDIMFNDIINPKSDGIKWASNNKSASVIADNAIINPGVSGDYITNNGTLALVTNNYETMTITNAKFTDTTYITNTGSPLIDAGWSNGKGITQDKFGNVRPQGITYDIGVYEASVNSSIPALITDTVMPITQTTATSGGNVTSNGGAAVTSRGACWSVSALPTVVNNHTTDGSGTGAFVSNITGLTGNTLYYVRAYATNVNGTAYGNQRSFTTLQNSALSSVTTNAVINIQKTTATCGGDVTSDGGVTVTTRGVCWSTSQNPTISDSSATDGSGIGRFTSYITDLKSHTRYYIRAYATNINGTVYGNQRNFMTLRSSPKDDESTDSTLELYPNPVKSVLTIAFYLTENSNVNLSVYNVNGIKMYNEQFNDQSCGVQKMQLNTSSFIEGLYIVVITTDQMVIKKNFIKLNR